MTFLDTEMAELAILEESICMAVSDVHLSKRDVFWEALKYRVWRRHFDPALALHFKRLKANPKVNES